jgi:Rieske Fe-S protein
MERKNFIKTCGFACICGSALSTVLQGCASSMILSGKIMGDDLIVALKDFETNTGDGKQFKQYVIVQNEMLRFPICVYRFNENDYQALWMRCTHQGNELQVFGDMLQCPAHGSEFDNKGNVRNGPAEKPLRTFPVTIESKQVRISLKAV